MNPIYITKAARAMQMRGALVVTNAPAPDPIPMFDIVACPRPFKENEDEALEVVIKALGDYYDQVLKAANRTDGFVFIQPATDPMWRDEHVALHVGVMAGDCHVGADGAEIVRRGE